MDIGQKLCLVCGSYMTSGCTECEDFGNFTPNAGVGMPGRFNRVFGMKDIENLSSRGKLALFLYLTQKTKDVEDTE